MQIDQHFADVFKDERFQSGQGKYGRCVEKTTNELKKVYRLKDEGDDDEDKEDEPAARRKKSLLTWRLFVLLASGSPTVT